MDHRSEYFLDNEKKTDKTFIYLIVSLFPIENIKMKRSWGIPFFNYIKIKCEARVFHTVLRQL